MTEFECAGILFDSDGVLVDSRGAVEVAYRRLAAEYRLDADQLISEMAGVRPVDVLRPHVAAADLGTAVDRFEDLEVSLAADATEIPGAMALLATLDGVPWAVVTSAGRRLAVVRWEAAGLPVPPAAVTADDTELGKPDPQPYLRAAALLGVAPERCVVFEDSPSGALAARAAGATVVAVGDQDWAFTPAARIRDLATVAVRSARDGFGLTLGGPGS